MPRKKAVSSSITLREAGFLDVPSMVRIEKRCFKRPWGYEAFFSEMFKGFSRVFVAEEAGRICGYVVLWVMPPEAYIANIAVDEGFRGRGIGSMLLEKAVDVAKEEGATYLVLEVRASNHAAQALYRKHGFEVVGVRRGMYHDGEDGLIMERLL